MNKKEKQRICKALLSSKIKVEQMSDTLFDTLEFLKIKKPLINQGATNCSKAVFSKNGDIFVLKCFYYGRGDEYDKNFKEHQKTA